jgi:hypothetical protein
MSNVLDKINVIYKGKERNISNMTNELKEIESKFKNTKDNDLSYIEYLKLRDRQDYLNKRLPIENDELRGMYIVIKLLKEEENNKEDLDTFRNEITLTDEQMNIIADKFENTTWGWHCDGCDCGEFQIEVENVGFVVVNRNCRKSNSTPQGMQYTFDRLVQVYNKSIIDKEDNYTYDSEDFEKHGIKFLGYIEERQALEIIDCARQNTIRDLGYDEYGNRVNIDEED